MIFWQLNKDFELLGELSPSNVQWNRKYYEFGDYSIVIPKNEYDINAKYIYRTDRKQLGIINKPAYDDSNKYITLSGYFIEKKLNDKVIYPTFQGKGEVSSVCSNLFNQYKKDLPINIYAIQEMASNQDIDIQITGEELGTKLYSILQTQEMSFKVDYDFFTNSLTLRFYKGLDRTQDQTQNNFVTFSRSFDNISSVKADIDDSNYKNYFIVAGGEEGVNRVVEYVDLSNGGYQKECFIDARDLQQQEGQSLDDYKLELRQRGLEKAQDYLKVTNITFNPVTSSYTYLVDYDLGDKCDIIINELGILIQARIIAVYEVIKNGYTTIELEFGDKILTKIDKLERRNIR